MGKVYGYARVSTREQNLDRQMDALTAFGVGQGDVFADKATGANFERPAYEALMGALREGDVLVIASLDRLGRDYRETQEQWRLITDSKQVDIIVLDMPLLNGAGAGAEGGLTRRFIADMVLQVMCYVAQMEREKIRQRQREGIDAALARGVRFGRARIPIPKNYGAVLAAYQDKEISRKEAAQRLGVSPSTFDKWRKNGIPLQ